MSGPRDRYLVDSPDPDCERHHTLEEAQEHAQRLAALAPGKRFCVYLELSSAKAYTSVVTTNFRRPRDANRR